MKKTLIALMALAGMACAADYTVENSWTVNFGSEYSNGYQITGSVESIDNTWDIVAVTGGSQTSGEKRVHLRDSEFGNWTDDFQFSITLTLGETISASNGWPVFAEIGGSNTFVRFGPYTNDGNYVSIDGDLTKNDALLDRTFSVAGGETYTVTLTKIGTDLTLAVDGRNVAFGTLADTVSGNITEVVLGGDHNNNYKINSTVHSVSYGIVTSAESPVVPEPATATLSLLALAGLAARRRRK